MRRLFARPIPAWRRKQIADREWAREERSRERYANLLALDDEPEPESEPEPDNPFEDTRTTR